MADAKCGSCQADLTHVSIQAIEARGATQRYRALAFVCPACRAIFSVGPDPSAQTSAIVQEIAQLLSARR
jgi:uncharacterized protein with PIN domain